MAEIELHLFSDIFDNLQFYPLQCDITIRSCCESAGFVNIALREQKTRDELKRNYTQAPKKQANSAKAVKAARITGRVAHGR